MNTKTFLLLGLLTGCDSLWQGQLRTDPTLCTQASSPCPTGQLCDFSAGTCQPIGGTNPPGWSVSAVTVSSCPQAPTITISGPASSSPPKVKLNTFTVDPDDVTLATDGTLTIKVPRQLPAGPVQVTLTFSANQPPVILSPGFQYETKSPGTTALILLPTPLTQVQPAASQVAAWYPKKDGPLDLAVLGGGGDTVVHYRNAGVASRQPVSFAMKSSWNALPSGATLQTANFATPDDALSPGDQALITATSDPGSAAFFVGDADAPLVKTVPALTPSYPLLRQLVAGGYFKDGEGSVQALTFIGWSSGTATLPIKRSPGPAFKNPGVTYLDLKAAVVNPLPLAVATGQLTKDANTDVILLVGIAVGSPGYAYSIRGGAAPQAALFANLPTTVSSVAIGNLDSDPLPDAVFGGSLGTTQNGQVAVYLNHSANTSPTISWDPAGPLTTQTRFVPSSVAVVDV